MKIQHEIQDYEKNNVNLKTGNLGKNAHPFQSSVVNFMCGYATYKLCDIEVVPELFSNSVSPHTGESEEKLEHR